MKFLRFIIAILIIVIGLALIVSLCYREYKGMRKTKDVMKEKGLPGHGIYIIYIGVVLAIMVGILINL